MKFSKKILFILVVLLVTLNYSIQDSNPNIEKANQLSQLTVQSQAIIANEKRGRRRYEF